MKRPTELTASGVRSRIEKFGFDLEEKGGNFRVTRPNEVAVFATLEGLQGFLAGVEAIVPAAVDA